eukprot:scaffold14720_cov65-Phaeocystis_antarctica.AAC.6
MFDKKTHARLWPDPRALWRRGRRAPCQNATPCTARRGAGTHCCGLRRAGRRARCGPRRAGHLAGGRGRVRDGRAEKLTVQLRRRARGVPRWVGNTVAQREGCPQRVRVGKAHRGRHVPPKVRRRRCELPQRYRRKHVGHRASGLRAGERLVLRVAPALEAQLAGRHGALAPRLVLAHPTWEAAAHPKPLALRRTRLVRAGDLVERGSVPDGMLGAKPEADGVVVVEVDERGWRTPGRGRKLLERQSQRTAHAHGCARGQWRDATLAHRGAEEQLPRGGGAAAVGGCVDEVDADGPGPSTVPAREEHSASTLPQRGRAQRFERLDDGGLEACRPKRPATLLIAHRAARLLSQLAASVGLAPQDHLEVVGKGHCQRQKLCLTTRTVAASQVGLGAEERHHALHEAEQLALRLNELLTLLLGREVMSQRAPHLLQRHHFAAVRAGGRSQRLPHSPLDLLLHLRLPPAAACHIRPEVDR